MSAEPLKPDPSPHEFVDAEIHVIGLETPAEEEALQAALAGRDGFKNLRITEGLVAVEYDPVRITKVEILKVIRDAGFKVKGVETGLASPIADAFYDSEHDTGT